MKIFNNQIYLSSVNLKDKIQFNKIAESYFKELNRNFKPSAKWKKNFLKNLIKNKLIEVKWIKLKKEICGFYILNYQSNNLLNLKKVKILDFFVKKKYRKKQVGFKSLRKIVSKLKKSNITKIEIEILTNNAKAFKFWNKFNFKLKSKIFYLKI